jgi:hypothetical protein
LKNQQQPGNIVNQKSISPQICAARQSRNQKHPPRRRGDTEKTQSESQSQNQNLNTEDTEKLGGRGGLKTRNASLKKKVSSRHGTNPFVSNADERRKKIFLSICPTCFRADAEASND